MKKPAPILLGETAVHFVSRERDERVEVICIETRARWGHAMPVPSMYARTRDSDLWVCIGTKDAVMERIYEGTLNTFSYICDVLDGLRVATETT